MIEILEWLAFGGSLISVWLYGRNPVLGPLAGIMVSIIFIIFGLASGIIAASASNVVFFIIHLRNYIKARAMDWERIKLQVASGFGAVQYHAHRLSAEAGWWDKVETPDDLAAVIPTKLCLIHSEISEAMEGHRKSLPDDHLPQYPMFAVELADAVIRIGYLAGKCGIDLGPIIADKMAYNAIRPDHKRDVRSQAGGKTY